MHQASSHAIGGGGDEHPVGIEGVLSRVEPSRDTAEAVEWVVVIRRRAVTEKLTVAAIVPAHYLASRVVGACFGLHAVNPDACTVADKVDGVPDFASHQLPPTCEEAKVRVRGKGAPPISSSTAVLFCPNSLMLRASHRDYRLVLGFGPYAL